MNGFSITARFHNRTGRRARSGAASEMKELRLFDAWEPRVFLALAVIITVISRGAVILHLP
jgi:hypothetical protein